MADPKLSISARWRRFRLCGVALFVVLLAVPASAFAGPQAPDDGCLTDFACRTSYDQAVVLFEGGRFEAALPKFQAAYARRQMPWLLINIGRTLHRLGRPKEALEYYERYKLAESKPDAETQERLEKYIVQAKALSDSPGSSPAPPGDTVQTPPPSTTPPPANSDPPKEGTPIYKKWWFWTAIGGGALAIIIIGAAAGAAANRANTPGNTIPMKTLPDGVMTVTFGF